MANNSTIEEDILLRLDVITKMLISRVPSNGESASAKDQILMLGKMGLSTAQIASLVGKKSKDVSSTLLKAKRKRKRK